MQINTTSESKIEEFIISDEYLVRTSGTSDGTQDKYCKDDYWFKLDRYGGEGLAETAASIILRKSGLAPELFVEYKPCLINGKNGCYSKDFLSADESFITLYRLYKNVTGRDLAAVTARMDYDDAIEYVINFVKEQTELDIHEYLANTFFLDMLILNEDRHFNNLGIIYDGTNFKTAPIFDNGKSFLIGNQHEGKAYAKAFSPSFKTNYEYLKKYSTLNITKEIINQIGNAVGQTFFEILQKTIKSAL